MDKLMEIVHPKEDHFLQFFEGSESVPLSQTCHKCMKQPVSRDYYKCTREGWISCGYYLHKECVELKDLPQFHHPLHPQHPLAAHYNYPCNKSFVCSFCGKTKQSRWFYQCSDDDRCDFYLDNDCVIGFTMRPELLDKYEIQHVLHHHENHRLSPYIVGYEFDIENRISSRCTGCTTSYPDYKCIACDFYLHTECAQVPKEGVQHQSHPRHSLVLLQNPPPPAAHRHHSDDEVRCAACLKWIEDGFYLHCNHCPTFNLHLHCYVRSKPTFKHEAHEHPLAYFSQIYDDDDDDDDDVRCYACNTPCKEDLFRCFTCNFNIHFGCHALPITVNHDDHVDSLILTTSFKEDGNPTTYYCDICEKRRDPDHGLYLCKECKFMAHFECALSLSTAEEKKYAGAHWHRKIEEDNHTSDEEEEEKSDQQFCVEIFDELNVEIEKLGEVIQELIIKERGGEKLTEKLQELGESYTKIEDILIRLKQSGRGTNYNSSIYACQDNKLCSPSIC